MKVNKIVLSFTTLALVSSLGATSVFAASNHNYEKGRNYQYAYGQLNQIQSENIGLSFNDLGNYSWAQNAIEQLAKRGVIHGVGNQRFNPGGNLTRGQLRTLLNNYFGQNTVAYNNSANDNQSMSRAETIQSIIENLINNGTLQLSSSTQTDQILSQYQDADQIPSNLRQYIATAIQNGIIHGTSTTTFDPSGMLTRAQIASILFNLQGLQGGQVPTTQDNSTISSEVPPGDNTGGSNEVPPGDTSSVDGTTAVNSTGITNVSYTSSKDVNENTYLVVQVSSSGISDGTPITVSLVDNNTGISYASTTGSITGNGASVDLPIPANLTSGGSYKITVSAGSYVNSTEYTN